METHHRSQASRERKERFLVESWGGAFAGAVARRLRRDGIGWLTDEQISDLVSDEVREHRMRIHTYIANRRIKREFR